MMQEHLVFGLSLEKLLVLGVLALVIFGPDRLPKIASQAGRALRDLRRIAENAKADLQEGLGPEFRDFDINDLNPRNFVRKHLWDEFDGKERQRRDVADAADRAVGAGRRRPAVARRKPSLRLRGHLTTRWRPGSGHTGVRPSGRPARLRDRLASRSAIAVS